LNFPSNQDIEDFRDRRDFRRFKRRVWWMPQDLVEGPHSIALGNRLTKAVQDFKAGRSTFLKVKMPFRHGKSDDISRAFPAYILGELREHDPDLIIASYGAELSESFSRKVKSIIQSDDYRALYPQVEIDSRRDAIGTWAIKGSTGEISAVGVRGSITGKGGHVIVVDDFFKSREEAESEVFRNRVWEGLKDNILTRRAPVCIFIICATPWHTDDPFGRIEKEMAVNPDFPAFEDLTFPAESKTYPSGYLFPARYSVQWYKSQRATLGSYAAAGLLDCNPQVRTGGIFKTENIVYHDTLDGFPAISYRRGWDLASTQKERASSDPDYTAGALCGARHKKDGALEVWIKDVKFCREEAPTRDKMILDCHGTDGPAVQIKIESVAGYKDAYTTLKNRLRGKAMVHKVNALRDKVAKLAFLEAPFEAGNVHMLRAPWNELLVSQFRTFPHGHDDGPDAVAVALEDFNRPAPIMFDRAGIGI
jgi:predicted phage terminase large subunit-like protein